MTEYHCICYFNYVNYFRISNIYIGLVSLPSGVFIMDYIKIDLLIDLFLCLKVNQLLNWKKKIFQECFT